MQVIPHEKICLRVPAPQAWMAAVCQAIRAGKLNRAQDEQYELLSDGRLRIIVRKGSKVLVAMFVPKELWSWLS